MIVDLPDTTTSQISKTLVKIREEGGAVALGRVLTLIISTKLGEEEEAIEAANDASREHPMRVIVVSTSGDENNHSDARLDAQIRVGGDAGASEVIVVRAYGDTASDKEGLRPSSSGGRATARTTPRSLHSVESPSVASRMPLPREIPSARCITSHKPMLRETLTFPGRGSRFGGPSSPRC
jgi:hypothetical protein